MMVYSLIRRVFIILLAAFSVAVHEQVVANELVIVKDGVSIAPIITTEGAPPFIQEAVEELASYIEKVSGAKPEIIVGTPDPIPEHAIWVGYQKALDSLFPKTDFDFKHPEEILIKASANHLVIVGRDRWHPDHLVVKANRETVNGVQREYGTVNAVYTFIQDQLNVRWLWPGELGEDVVTRKSIAFAPFEQRYHPPLLACAKVLTFSVLLKHSAYGQSSDWSRKQRLQLDSLDVHPGHSFKDWWERFHETHPEYFALQPDGTRSGYPSPRYVKLCVSNPDVWKQWLADVEAQIEHNPNLTIFNTAPNDSYGTGHCVCEKCQAWDHPEADLLAGKLPEKLKTDHRKVILERYPEPVLEELEKDLRQAENTEGLSEKDKIRLQLTRIEFDYLNALATVFNQHKVFTENPTLENLENLEASVNKRKDFIAGLFDADATLKTRTELFNGIPLFGKSTKDELLNGWGKNSQLKEPFDWDFNEQKKRLKIPNP